MTTCYCNPKDLNSSSPTQFHLTLFRQLCQQLDVKSLLSLSPSLKPAKGKYRASKVTSDLLKIRIILEIIIVMGRKGSSAKQALKLQQLGSINPDLNTSLQKACDQPLRLQRDNIWA